MPTSSRDDARRSSSMISNKNIRLRNTANTDIKHFKKLITVPFNFTNEGSKILFKNIDKKF